ncbi:MAG: hypothetical protein DBY40_02035 [Clostridiales bacterium]|nr:MAG: hypothetical protein DBY40_02035 [Clostridiales bacterium]
MTSIIVWILQFIAITTVVHGSQTAGVRPNVKPRLTFSATSGSKILTVTMYHGFLIKAEKLKDA